MGDVIRLHGVACGRCGHPGHTHNTRTGQTTHVAAHLPPCQTKPPSVAPPTLDTIRSRPDHVRLHTTEVPSAQL